MVIGRWSEFSLVWAAQVKEGRRWDLVGTDGVNSDEV
jgi:hypothetical protein